MTIHEVKAFNDILDAEAGEILDKQFLVKKFKEGLDEIEAPFKKKSFFETTLSLFVGSGGLAIIYFLILFAAKSCSAGDVERTLGVKLCSEGNFSGCVQAYQKEGDVTTKELLLKSYYAKTGSTLFKQNIVFANEKDAVAFVINKLQHIEEPTTK